MKNKLIAAGLVIGCSLAPTSAFAQYGFMGAPASGNQGTSSGDSGNMGQTDYLNTGRQAFQEWHQNQQNYVSPQTQNPGNDDHSANQSPQVRAMRDSAGGMGLNNVSTAPMAPDSFNNAPIPSGSFHYGFNGPENGGAPQAYLGAYKSGGMLNSNLPRYGGMLPQVSSGSVDFNTVDMTGVAPAGMISPGRGGRPLISRPTIPSLPNQTSSANSVYDWLNTTFFGN